MPTSTEPEGPYTEILHENDLKSSDESLVQSFRLYRQIKFYHEQNWALDFYDATGEDSLEVSQNMIHYFKVRNCLKEKYSHSWIGFFSKNSIFFFF